MRRSLLTLLCTAALAGTPSPEYLSAKQKIELIGSDRAPPGSRILLTSQELNAWVRTELAVAAPQGLREPRLELGHDAAAGFAYVDFPKLRQAAGKPLNWLLAGLLAGERPVRVRAKITSGAGQARVDLEHVEISGMSIQGAALDLLIDMFLRPYVPGAKVGEPFALKHRIERLDIRPTFVQVVIQPKMGTEADYRRPAAMRRNRPSGLRPSS